MAANIAGIPPRLSSQPSEAEAIARPRLKIAMNTANCVAATAGVHSRIAREPPVTLLRKVRAVKRKIAPMKAAGFVQKPCSATIAAAPAEVMSAHTINRRRAPRWLAAAPKMNTHKSRHQVGLTSPTAVDRLFPAKDAGGKERCQSQKYAPRR